MEVQDGFIVGIFNYCDRWCERCPLTNRCRLFAQLAEMDFEEGNVVRTEPLLARQRRKMVAQVIEMHTEATVPGEAGRQKPAEHVTLLPADLEPCVGPDPEVVKNGPELRKKMQRVRLSANPAVRLAAETITYFSLFVPMKSLRALSQVARKGPGAAQSDANGSAKAALLGLGRMEKAWRILIDTHHISARDAAPFLAEIARMQRNLTRAAPGAMAFVRPGFDETDEVNMLQASSC